MRWSGSSIRIWEHGRRASALRLYAFERIPQKFVRGEAKEPDSFDDEICLLIKERDGLALVVGCSHQGILNITATVKARTGLPVRRIIGGRVETAGCSDVESLPLFGSGRTGANFNRHCYYIRPCLINRPHALTDLFPSLGVSKNST